MFNVYFQLKIMDSNPGKETMENSKLQSTFTLINSIKFEEKIDTTADLVLPSEQKRSTRNMENIDIKEKNRHLKTTIQAAH